MGGGPGNLSSVFLLPHLLCLLPCRCCIALRAVSEERCNAPAALQGVLRVRTNCIGPCTPTPRPQPTTRHRERHRQPCDAGAAQAPALQVVEEARAAEHAKRGAPLPAQETAQRLQKGRA